jgi:hypothetical protein
MIPNCKLILNYLFLATSLQVAAQQKNGAKNAIQKTYQNPIIHADYSDPDVISVGDDAQ